MSNTRSLGEIAEIVRGISFPKEAKSTEPRSGDVACLRTTNVQEQVEWEDLWFVPAKHVKRDEQYVRQGDILISTANSYELVGKVALVLSLPRPSTLGAFISLIRPRDGVNPKFLYHQLAWKKTQSRIRETASTTTNISNVSTKKLAALDLRIPALDKQDRIVAEIEKQFSRLDEAAGNLKRVKANLKRYKTAVLKAAVEGRLVPTEAELARREGRSYESGEHLLRSILEARRSQWKGKGKYKEPAAPDTTNLPELPEGWVSVAIAQLLSQTREAMKTGPFGSLLKKYEHQIEGIAVLGIENIQAMHFVPGSKIHITQQKAHELEDYRVVPGDVLISRSGTVGEVCVVPNSIGDARMSTNLMKVSLAKGGMLPEFFILLFNGSPFVLNQVSDLCKGSTRDFLNQEILKQLCFLLPPLVEQHRIVAEVERHLSLIREIDADIAFNSQRAERLRQAILKEAYAGNLRSSGVPNIDPILGEPIGVSA